ncbi:MAG: hypothetical protein H6765_10815 [Candidatus Peribacteria bacterium]|nr:MAG: hypothetical protein H6765_10815 [Candidatus Peribacteria bacterium]
MDDQLQEELDGLIQVNASHLGIETHAAENVLATMCPNRGGTMPGLKIGEKDIFYQDPEKRADLRKSVRESFWMFPVAGKLPPELQQQRETQLAQHGFGRDMKWTIDPAECGENYWTYTLAATPETLSQFPYQFRAKQTITMHHDQIVLGLEVENLDDKPMPVSPGHHTYYKVAANLKQDIQLDPALRVDPEDKQKWIEGTTTLRLKNPNHPVRIAIP